MSAASSMKTSCAFNMFIQSLPPAWFLLTPWNEAEIITVPKPGKDTKFPSDQPLGYCLQTV
jgi:hypothetical protein